MADKGPNLFNECAARYIHLSMSTPLPPKGTVKCMHLAA